MKAPDLSLSGIIDLALSEDVGAGDWTTEWTVPSDRVVTAAIMAKAPGTVAGLDVVRLTFERIDPSLSVSVLTRDGDRVAPGDELVRVYGRARPILTAERVALNLLQHLSGIATATRAFVDAVSDTGARILDTRKTTPGLRALEKRAVVAGGGFNHRFGLYDMVLIKENHIRAAGGITAAIQAVAAANHAGLKVEVETTTIEEVREALTSKVDRILLDNMSIEELKEAVQIIRASDGSVETEASGGVSLAKVRAIAEAGVDFISIGALTHSITALDVSLLIVHED